MQKDQHLKQCLVHPSWLPYGRSHSNDPARAIDSASGKLIEAVAAISENRMYLKALLECVYN